jgi:hypothetical protein
MSSQLAGPEVTDVAVVRSVDGAARVVVSTGVSLSVYDSAMNLLGRRSVDGSRCVKIQRFSDGGQSRAMCFFADGTASVLTCE